MLLLLIVLLTLIGIALRIIISGLDVAYYVAKKAESIRRKTGNVATKIVTRKGSWQRKVARITGFGLDRIGDTAKLSGYVLKSVIIAVLKKTIKFIKFIVDRVRDLLCAVSTFVFVLDILVFFVIVAGSAGFIALYCKSDENGNIVFDEDVLKLLDQNDVSDDSSGEGSLTEEEVQALILRTCKKITDYVREKGYSYGDAPVNPCMDKSVHLISCDRFVDWVLYDLGWTDQPKDHGPVVRHSDPKMDLTSLCEKWGFTKITSVDDLKPGDIIFQGAVPYHVFIVGKYHDDQKLWERYDCGNDNRITGSNPSPSVEPINDFGYAYRMDYKKLGLGNKKKSSGSAGAVFTAYNVSKDDLEWLTRLCEAENDSSNKAIAAEISTAMNLWEDRHPEESLRTYCNRTRENQGWFAARSRSIANGNSGYGSEAHYKIVEAACNQGKRIYPKYVDEHDCYGDISSITNNGQSVGVSQSNLIQNVSLVTNVYGSVWYFYDLPDPNSDPFGYTTDTGVQNREKYGENHYDWDKLKSELGID